MIVDPSPFEPITAEQWAELRASWPNAERLRWAWNLAPDLDTLADLITGVPVAPERLDQDALAKAREATLVTLTRPIDLMDVAA